MKLTASQKNELLIRLDERTNNIWRVAEKLERHQEEQNGFIKEALLASAKNTMWRKITITIFTGITTVIGILFSKFQGWW